MEILWNLAVFLCVLFVFLHPTKQGFKVGSAVLVSILIPEIFKNWLLVDGKAYFTVCFFAIATSLCILCKFLEDSDLATVLKSFLILEIFLNAVLSYLWSSNADVYVSNYFFDLYGIVIADILVNDPNRTDWIMITVFTSYYFIMSFFLWDSKGRKEYVGNGFLQLVADKYLSDNLRFKGLGR